MANENILAKLKKCKTVAELKAAAKKVGYELTDDEAKAYFNKIVKSGELSDDELTGVNGGGCTRWRNGRAYSGNPPHLLIVTMPNSCSLYDYCNDPDRPGLNGTCATCTYFSKPVGLTCYCRKRKYYDDPLNK